MKIHNVRLGFANNSSSTHSLLFINGKLPKDTAGNGDFGWDFFTASAKDSKQRYVHSLLRNQLFNLLGDKTAAQTIAKEWMGVAGDKDDYVDGQSAYDFPLSWNGKIIHRGFFKAFQEFILRNDLVILGGNDNTDQDHPLIENRAIAAGKSFNISMPMEYGHTNTVVRKDLEVATGQEYWTMFNRSTGAKFRVSFDSPGGYTPVKSVTPELVDVKITDYCPFNCAYCYQDSTSKGQHARTQSLRDLSYELAKMKVFEVALGGGETTMHPDFVEILKSFRSNGVVPNFTTKSLHWLRDPKVWVPVIKNAGSFAFSVEKSSDIKELATLLEFNGINTNDYGDNSIPVSIQYVMGVAKDYEFSKIIEACHENSFQLTLLGFKTTGRGDAYKKDKRSLMKAQQHPTKWISILEEKAKNYRCPSVGIDTALAQQSLQSLIASKVPKWLYHVDEGKFSMYIDAVTGKIGPSSYGEESEMIQLPKQKYCPDRIDFGGDNIRKHYAQW